MGYYLAVDSVYLPLYGNGSFTNAPSPFRSTNTPRKSVGDSDISNFTATGCRTCSLHYALSEPFWGSRGMLDDCCGLIGLTRIPSPPLRPESSSWERALRIQRPPRIEEPALQPEFRIRILVTSLMRGRWSFPSAGKCWRDATNCQGKGPVFEARLVESLSPPLYWGKKAKEPPRFRRQYRPPLVSVTDAHWAKGPSHDCGRPLILHNHETN
nr:MAG: hypothetical protein H3BulkLitter17978_000002 [Mitovirus sp.]